MNAPLLPGRIEHWPLARLKPYARNAKTHDANQVAKIAASMAEFGWTVPVLVAADGELIAGHGRILAAAHLGLSDAPVIVLGHLTEAQRRACRIADNKLTELGGWDEALLLQELQALLAEDFDLGLIGIPEDELDALLNAGNDDRTVIDDDAADAIPAPPAEPITRPGDIWALGKHRLCCGDATDPAAVARLMQGEQATLMFTSPPYAQQRDYGAAKERVGDWDALMQGVFAAAPVIAEAQLLVNLGLVHRDSEWQPYWEGWVEWMRASGWRRFGWYVWDQGPGLPGDWNGRLAPSHEFIFHFNSAPRKPRKTVPSKHAGETLGGGGLRGADGTVHAKTGTGNAIQSHRIPDSVFRIMRHKGGLGAAGSHPAVFPVALVEAVLTAFSDPGDLIYEPFCGSGTQIIAAERAGRRCFAMELDPVYCDVAVRRWERATGKKSTLGTRALSPGLWSHLLATDAALTRLLRQIVTNGLPVVLVVNAFGLILFAQLRSRRLSPARALAIDIPARIGAFIALHVVIYPASALMFGSFGGDPVQGLRVVGLTLTQSTAFGNLSGV